MRRSQFTEVTGSGGIHGATNPGTDPIWAIGWDYKSLILGVRMPEQGWTFYRLPKSSHSYDGAHGWNTEWPRIREIGDEKNYLMTGFDKKSLTITTETATKITAQIDLTGTGNWVNYKTFQLQPGQKLQHTFPTEFQAYWIRFTSDKDTKASAHLSYE